jgi:putative AlgH/UPF0301 family transcriptional regulator
MTMRRLLYSQILKQARCVDNHPPTKILLAAIPIAVWSRIHSKIVYIPTAIPTDVTTTVSNFTAAELSNYLNQHFTIDSMVSRLNDHAEFYLPPSSNDSTVSLSLKTVVHQTRRQAALLRQQLHTAEQKQSFDAFFDDLGFEAVREGGALLRAQQNLFSSTPLPKSNLTWPFQLEPPTTTRYKYNREESYTEMTNTILLTHPTACIGQHILHSSVILMMPRGMNDDEMYGIVVNKPGKQEWKQQQSNNDHDHDETCCLRDVLRPEDVARFKEDADARVQSMLDVPVFQGGPVQTSLLLLHEVEEDSDAFQDGETDIETEDAEKEVYQMENDPELFIGKTGRLRLTVVERVLDLQKLVQKKFIDPARCKLFVGLCVWQRDQLGTELERNTWIRTTCNDINDLTELGLHVSKEASERDFAGDFWSASVAQLGEPYKDIATIETDHTVLFENLGKQVQDRAQRMTERFEKQLILAEEKDDAKKK